MKSKDGSEGRKYRRFSESEVRGVLVAIGLGILLGVAAEMLDRALPKRYRLGTVLTAVFDKPAADTNNSPSAYDMGKPNVRFPITDRNK
jgi:hypothetical protein